MAEFTETKGKLEAFQIKEMESFAGLTFPEQYKEHLLNFNGGRCKPDVFWFVENGNKTASAIGWFFAIYDGKYNNLRDCIEIYKRSVKRMPSYVLPFASDVVGNAICISCGKDDFGKIYFWDHEREVDYKTSDDSDYSNLYFIANSFNEFLENLTSGEDVV